VRLRLDESDMKTYERAAGRYGLTVNVPAKLWREYEAAFARLHALTDEVMDRYNAAQDIADEKATKLEARRIARAMRKRGTITREELADGVATGRYLVLNS
jgi:hypothetical protein